MVFSLGSLARFSVEGANLAQKRDNTDHSPYTPSARRTYALQCVAVSVASVSLCSAIVSFYWFLRMRRSFRHDLIMLLIQGDLLKAFWLVLFPLVALAGGSVQTSTAFCQISGFFLAAGIESCDIAVLLVSVHAAVYLFNPKRSGGEHGLYPYRRVAYAIAIAFPLTMASLAFVNGAPGYWNTGQFCYLSTTQTWYRQYLSWVPRYVFFSIIIVLKIAMYVYVRMMLDKYSRRTSSVASTNRTQPPPTPPLEYHGLIPSTLTSRRSIRAPSRDRKDSCRPTDRNTSTGSLRSACRVSFIDNLRRDSVRSDRSYASMKTIDVQHTPKRKGWSQWEFRQSPLSDPDRICSHVDPRDDIPSAALVVQPEPVHASTSRRASLISPTSNEIEHRDESFWHRPVNGSQHTTNGTNGHTRTTATPLPPAAAITSPSILNMIAVLRKGPPRFGSDIGTSSPSLNINHNAVDDSTGMTRYRDRTRRQLRLLFIYPLAYIIMWSIPFMSHLLDFDDTKRDSYPLWLNLLTLISIAAQGTVNCALFMWQETPWRYVKGGFWESLGLRMNFDCCSPRRIGGRSREEMHDDERLARLRRNEEAVQEHASRAERERLASGTSRDGSQRKITYWWDHEIDGMYSDDEDGVVR